MSLLNQTARASALAIMALAFTASPLQFASAQSSSNSQTGESQIVSRQFSAKAGEVVLKAQSRINSDDFTGALTILSNMKGVAELTSYERSIIAQMQGASYSQLGQYGPAILAFERAVQAGGLLPKDADDLSVKIAQLMIVNGQHRLGAQKLEAYLDGGGPLEAQYIEMLTQAWIQAEDYKRALPWAEKWFAAASPKARKHYDLLNFLFANLEAKGRQADLVKEMIEHWPDDKKLWDAWASLLAQSGQEKDAFEVNKLLYLGGALTKEADIMKVVQYYAYYNMPYQAAQILEKEMNAGRVSKDAEKLVQLSTLFRQAREYARAIPVLEAATQTDGTADQYAQLGEALYNEGQCARAEVAFKQGIDHGYDAGKAWMLIATCRYEDVQEQQKLSCEMNDAERAAAPKSRARQLTIAAFEKVPPISPQSRDAKKWISFITAERKTFDQRCIFEGDRLMKTCYHDIKQAYDAQFITGTLELNDAKCEKFVTAFDKEYRSKKAG